jgi:hypothetical protein
MRQDQPFEKANWTPRALEVLATAKKLASADGPVTADHLLLALEVGETVASQVLRRLAISPSTALGHSPPAALSPDGDLYYGDFETSLSEVFPRVAYEESKSVGAWYFGTEHLLLMLARRGTPGVDLQYDSIRQATLEVLKKGLTNRPTER